MVFSEFPLLAEHAAHAEADASFTTKQHGHSQELEGRENFSINELLAAS